MTYEPREGVDYIVDFYALSEAERDASEEELKQALNSESMKYHPDRLMGTAREFREKGERIAVLLNRARAILLDAENRKKYDDILTTWDGPVSTDGTPIITAERQLEANLQEMSAEEVEAFFAEQAKRIVDITGYNPSRLNFLEKLVEQAGNNVPEELRAEYEDALLQKDRALAIEERERSQVLGLPDIETQDYVAVLGYGEETSRKLEVARNKKKNELQGIALGDVSAALALTAGIVAPQEERAVAQSGTSLELPAYYDEQAAKVQEIASVRDDITEKRLGNFEPEYPKSELQTELNEDLIIGVASGDKYVWLGAKLDVETDSADFQEVAEEVKELLNLGDYKTVISDGNGVILVKQMEHIDIQDLLGVAIGKYTDKYKNTDRTTPD
jgi:hypothetical protein